MTTSREQDEFFTAKRFALFLALALGVMFFRVLLAGETFYYRDFGVLAVPTATFHKTSILAGEIPFWNPYSNCGTPFLAQWGTMVLYPLSLIYVLLPMPWSLNFFCIVHLWLGGMGMYLLAKRWCGGTWPAALAWPNYIAAIALTPWVLLLTDRVWTPHAGSNSLQRTTISGEVIAAALASTLQLLAGVPELCVLTWLLVTAFWAARIVRTPAAFKPLLLLYVAVVLATTGLASIQLLPFYELLSNSHRNPGFAAEKWALPIWGWANLILPRFRTFVTPQGTAFQYTQEFLTSVYIGIPLLVLAWCSFLRRTPRFWILAIASALGAVLALGSAGILYPILTKLFPPLGIARYPVKFLFLLAFTVPLLAASGANALFEMPDRRRRTILGFSTAATAVLLGALIAIDHAAALPFERLAEFRQNSLIRVCLAFSMLAVIYFATAQTPQRATAQFIFLLLLILDARTHLQKLNPTIAASIFKGELWSGAHPFPKPVHGQARAFISREAEEKLLYSPVADDEKELIGKRLAEWSHLNLLDRVPKVNGSSTLQVREQARVQSFYIRLPQISKVSASRPSRFRTLRFRRTKFGSTQALHRLQWLSFPKHGSRDGKEQFSARVRVLSVRTCCGPTSPSRLWLSLPGRVQSAFITMIAVSSWGRLFSERRCSFPGCLGCWKRKTLFPKMRRVRANYIIIFEITGRDP